MDNYRRFASKYNAQGPKLDPLVKKKLGHDDNDRSPGRNLYALNNLSQKSLGQISIEYNEGSFVKQRQTNMQKGNFMRKSQSISGMIPSPKRQKGDLTAILASKENMSGRGTKILNRNNSNDLTEVYDQEPNINTNDLQDPYML